MNCPYQFVNGILTGLPANRVKSVKIIGKLTRQLAVFGPDRDDDFSVSIGLLYLFARASELFRAEGFGAETASPLTFWATAVSISWDCRLGSLFDSL